MKEDWLNGEYSIKELSKLTHDDLLKKRRSLLLNYSNLGTKIKIINEVLSCQCYAECFMCEVESDYGYNDLPMGWHWVKGYRMLLCAKCSAKWTDKYGDENLTRGEI